MRNTILLLLTCLLFGCNPAQDEAFQLFYQDFQDKLEKEPIMRAFIEEELFFDSIQVIPYPQEVQRILTLSKDQLEALHEFKPERIDESLQEHFTNLHSFLRIIIQNIEQKKIHQTDPEFYAILPYLKNLIRSEAVATIGNGLDQTSSHFKVAIENLSQPNPAKLESAISESVAVFEFLSNDVKDRILFLKPDKIIEKEVLNKLTQASLEVKNYIGYCNSHLFEAGNKD